MADAVAVPYSGQLLDHELYRVTMSDRTKAGQKVNELVCSEAFTFDADGSRWWYEAVPGKRGRMTKEAFGWIERYLRKTYGMRFRGPRPELED